MQTKEVDYLYVIDSIKNKIYEFTIPVDEDIDVYDFLLKHNIDPYNSTYFWLEEQVKEITKIK